MTPLSDRTVVVALLSTIALVFALVFWAVRLAPPERPLLWRESAPQVRPAPAPAPAARGTLI
ncbi:MAG: hypothetical protein VKK43_04625 [Synechococcaceae cyanobacterium]|jgi:hypothetical protein|nr:hypothetical protein [Synechococcaceae cyanobacterium]